MQKFEHNLTANSSGALRPLSGASVTVTDNANGLPAALYSDNGVTPLAQPLTTDNTGYFAFYAADGKYTLTFSGPRFATFTREILLEDPADNPAVTEQALALPSGAGKVGFGKRTVEDKLGEVVSPEDFGAVGDGIANDYAPVQAFFTYLAATGKQGIAPAATYLLSQQVAVMSGAHGIHFRGAGMEKTVFKRDAFNGSTLKIHNLNGCVMSDFTVDGNRAVAGGAAGFDGANFTNSFFTRIQVRNTGTTGMWCISDGETITQTNVHMIECYALNTGATGFQLQGARYSGQSRCVAVNTGIDFVTNGNSGAGVAFKVPVEHCYQSDNSVDGCAGPAFAVGSSFPGSKGKYLTFTNGRGRNCGMGIRIGEVEDSVFSNIVAELSGVTDNGRGDGVRMEGGSLRNSLQNIAIRNVAADRAAARFSETASYNTVELSSFKAPQAGALVAAFAADTNHNKVKLARGYDATSGVEVQWAGVENVYEIDGRPLLQSQTAIAAGVVTLRHAKIEHLRIDTEALAATDDLDTITASLDGHRITVTSHSDARDVTVKHAVGNIRLNGTDFTLATTRSTLTLVYSTRAGAWCEVSRSAN